ncbi:MAG: hypothetical protein ACFFCQ_17315, partial [Promethearchaeota archaeon]
KTSGSFPVIEEFSYHIPFLGNPSTDITHLPHSVDMLYANHGKANGSYVVTFSGIAYNDLKPDPDIWVMYANAEALNWSRPFRITTTGTPDLNPDLVQLTSSDGSIMLTWERENQDPLTAIGVSYCKTTANIWTEPDTLDCLPDFVKFRSFPVLGLILPTWDLYPNVIFQNLQIKSPSIAALSPSGFAYTCSVSFNAYLLELIKVNMDTLSDVSDLYVTNQVYQYQFIPVDSLETIANYYNSLSGETNVLGSIGTLSVGYYLLQHVAQILENCDTRSFPPTTSTCALSYLNSPTTGNYSYVAGSYSNIYVRVNTGTKWLDFDFNKATKVDVGDTDADARREIVVTTENHFYLSEIDHSQVTATSYHQIWHSNNLGLPIADLAVYDANGNGLEEIIVSTDGGNVYSFEVTNSIVDQTLLQFTNSLKISDQSWSPFTRQKPTPILANFDATGDGIDEIVLANQGSGTTNLTIYNGGIGLNYDVTETVTKEVQGTVTQLKYHDVNFDGFPDLAYGTDQGEFAVIDVFLSLFTNSMKYCYLNETINDPINSIHFVYRPLDSFWGLLVISSTQILLNPAWGSGSYWSINNLTLNSIIGGEIGYFGITPVETTEGLIMDELGNIYLLDLTNGQLSEKITDFSDLNSSPVIFAVTDLNNDNIDDLLLALQPSVLLAIDITESAILWNYTDFDSIEQFKQLLITDCDSDGASDIFLCSDSSISDLVSLTYRDSFENETGYPNLSIDGTQITEQGLLMSIPGDYILPSVTILSPVSNTQYFESKVLLLYNTSSTYPVDPLLYINDVSYPIFSANGTEMTFTDGSYNLTLVVKDTLTNITGRDSVLFSVDTTPSTTVANLLSPKPITYTSTDILVLYNYFAAPVPANITQVEIWLNDVDMTASISNNSIFSFNLGVNNFTLYVEDDFTPQPTTKTVLFTVNPTLEPIKATLLTPSEGTHALIGSEQTSEFSFITPISRVAFNFWTNGSSNVTIKFYNDYSSIPAIVYLYQNDLAGVRLDFIAIDMGINIFTKFEISSNFSLSWYMDEIEYDILQSRSYIRCFSDEGSLNWRYDALVDRIEWMEIYTSNNIIPSIGLIGLANTYEFASAYDTRGLLALDLTSGRPTFYGGIKENVYGGIMGNMYDNVNSFVVDG